jgi:hypothetical protein
MKDNSKLLREYVRHVLSEEGDSATGSSDIARAGITASDLVTGPGGHGGGKKGAMYMTFISPFVDVVKTAAGKAKELARESITTIQVALSVVLTTLIPALNARYDKIFSDRDKDIAKIRNEYKDVYERTNKALSSTDATVMAFLAAPQTMLAAWAASKSPAVTKGILSTLTGGMSDELFNKAMSAKFKNSDWESKLKKLFQDEDVRGVRSKKEGRNKSGLLLKEADDVPEEVKYAQYLLKNPEFHELALKKSGVLDDLKKVGEFTTKAYRNTLVLLTKDAEESLGSSATFESLEKLSGKRAEELDDVRNLKGPERKNADEIILKNSKDAIKNFYVTKLEGEVSKMKKDGVPEDSQIVKDYLSAIQKIKSL